VVKQTTDAPNSPFRTVRGAKQRREKAAHAIHDASTALKGVWKRPLTAESKFSNGKPPTLAKDQTTLLQPVIMLIRPLRDMAQYMRQTTITNAFDGKASQHI
jgi:hypothetical protein